MNARPFGLRIEHLIEMESVLFDVIDGMELGVDRHQVIVLGDLQPVSAVIEERDVGARGFFAEFGDQRLHLREVRVDREGDLESQRFQRVGDVLGVVRRIGELGDRFVAAVADHQRDLGLAPGWRDDYQRRRRCGDRARQPAKPDLHPLRRHRRLRLAR